MQFLAVMTVCGENDRPAIPLALGEPAVVVILSRSAGKWPKCGADACQVAIANSG
jgi:hypothetical protein